MDAPWAIRSKCEHIAGVPLLPETAKQLYKVYLSKGAHATTAIEGNTLSEEEVLQRVEGTLELPDLREYSGCGDRQHRQGVQRDRRGGERGRSAELTPQRVKHLNGLVLSGLDSKRASCPESADDTMWESGATVVLPIRTVNFCWNTSATGSTA